MATTITISEETRRRLAGYKHGDVTYDDLLNSLMDHVPVEDVALEHVEAHYRRLKNFQPITPAEFRAKVARARGEASLRGRSRPKARKGPAARSRSRD